MLNEYFTTVASTIIEDIPNVERSAGSYLKEKRDYKSLFFRPIVEEDIFKYIRKMAPKPTEDIYEMNAMLVKKIMEFISSPLTDIINACFEQGIFPNKMKIAKICPILKKGDPKDVNNYRPIAILPIFSKILEMAMADQITSFLLHNNLMAEEQFGFQANKSTILAAKNLCDYIIEGFEERNVVSVRFYDITKAFDCMCHEIFSMKIDHYGIKGIALSLVKSFLTDRYQIVQNKMDISCMLPLQHGIPQGSILGPLFFILYMNDLPGNLKCHSVLYADDTTLAIKHEELRKIEKNMEDIDRNASEWFNANKLCLNKNKTKSLLFTSSKRTSSSTDTAPFLGFIMDTRLTWANHCEKLVHCLHKLVFSIRRIKQIINVESALEAYFALFHSRMTYGIEIWGVSAHITKVLKAQKEAIRALEGVSPETHCRPLFLKYRIRTVVSELVIKLVMDIKYNSSTHQTRGHMQPYNIRSNKNLQITRKRLNIGDRLTVGTRLYNRLPLEWRTLTATTLKKTLKVYFKEYPVYHLEEVDFSRSTN